MDTSNRHPQDIDDTITRFSGDPVVVVSPDRRLVYANRPARRLFGIGDNPGIASLTCCDIMRLSICNRKCPAGRRPEDGVIHDYFVSREGCPGVYCVSTSFMFDESGDVTGMIHAVKNMDMVQQLVDEQKRTQEALRLGQRKMQSILDAVADGVFTVERDGRIAHYGRSMQRITGYTEREVVGKHCREVFQGSACGAGCPIERTLRDDDRVERCRETLLSKDGAPVPVFITTSLIRGAGGVHGVVCCVDDRLEPEARQPGEAGPPFPGFVGKSVKMQKLFELVEAVSGSDAGVLIEGETGTGKELVARAIHRRSGRGDGPFVSINCSALSPLLLESELFGHVRGAFTGAIRDKQGKFEAADGGTLLLDEISELSLEMQVKLLRFLQSKEFERVGDTLTRQVDVRIIAASNRNLKNLARTGAFREDLYYRLHVIPVNVPPLRERREDIPLLVEHFLTKYRHLNRQVEGLSTRALHALMGYTWPGNVRELENAILFAVASTRGTRIERRNLPPAIRGGSSAETPDRPERATREEVDLHGVERRRIVRLLEENNWRVGATAKAIGYSRSTLWRRMIQLNIRTPNRHA